MIVCICHRVSDRDIAHAVHAGCESFDQLQDELRVATGCGACDDCARETLEQHRTQVTCAMVTPWDLTGAVPSHAARKPAARERAGA